MASEPRLFDLGAGAPATPNTTTRPEGRVVRVVPDVAGIAKTFDYVVPPKWVDRVSVGTMVRCDLGPRRVAAWVVELDVTPPGGVALAAITKVSSAGPPAEIVALSQWAAWRWAGRVTHFLGAASPPRAVDPLEVTDPLGTAGSPRAARSESAPGSLSMSSSLSRAEPLSLSPQVLAGFTLTNGPRTIVRLPPARDPAEVAISLSRSVHGDVLVVCPTVAQARLVAAAIRKADTRVVLFPDGWAAAARGNTCVVGTRTAVFAPMPRLGAILVVDEHDEALQNEGSPTWNAREVAFERGRRREVPVVLTSPTPSLEAQKWARLEVLGRSEERAGWAALKILDRREEDTGRAGLFSEALIRSLKSPGRVVCVLNRTGRSLLFACRSCNSLASCERCGALVREGEDPATLVCGHCGAVRPHVCANCGMARFKTLRVGVSRAAELLSTLMREPVDELTARAKPGSTLGNARVFLGTEAVLHRVPSASVVAFLEFDQELLAPRYRAAEAALTLLARASRVVGGRAGQVVVQTSMPDHEVLRAAMLAEPALVSESEHVRREMLGFPPARSMVVVGGEHAGEYVREIEAVLAAEGVADAEVVERSPSQWLIRSSQRAAVLNAIASVKRPPGRMRVQVDPMRLPPA